MFGAITSVDPSNDVFTRAGHGLSIGDRVRFYTTGVYPAPLVLYTYYYIIANAFTTGQFRLSTTANGSVLDITTAGTGTLTYARATDYVCESMDVEEVSEVRVIADSLLRPADQIFTQQPGRISAVISFATSTTFPPRQHAIATLSFAAGFITYHYSVVRVSGHAVMDGESKMLLELVQRLH